MRYIAVGLLSGCTLLLQMPELPHLAWLAIVSLAVLLAILNIKINACRNALANQRVNAKQGPENRSYRAIVIDFSIRFSIGLILGFSWALYSAHNDLSDRLPQTLEGVDLIVTGNVAGIPQRSDTLSRFDFVTKTVDYILPDTGTASVKKPLNHTIKNNNPERVKQHTLTQFQANKRLRLTWYRNAPQLQSGDSWQFRVRLKRPNGFMNPGGFDYEGWLFRHGIDAVGYVRAPKINMLPDPNKTNRRLSTADGPTVDRLRQILVIKMTKSLPADSSIGLVRALVVGDRSGISPQQWQTMRDTGTNHLMAISGLHIALVAGFAFFLLRWIWVAVPGLLAYLPAQKAAAIAAIVAAFIYAGLAGFSIPTQRAFIMVTIAMLSLLLQRRFQAGQYLSLALIGVLLLDPFAPMDAGFFLSFGAVAVLMIGMSHRLGAAGLWWSWGRSQWVVFIGLLPLIVFYFGALPLSAPLANIIAIPWVTFLTVPLSLIAAVLVSLSDSVGAYVLQWADYSLQLLWPILEWIQALIPVYPVAADTGIWAVVAAIIGSVLLLLPSGIPARWLGLLWLVPLFWPQSQKLPLGEIKFTMLDVGQGLSLVVETTNHVLIYDTGAKFSQHFDSASAALLPYLRQSNLNKVDTLVLSHNDNDHVGSAESLLAGVQVEQIMSSYHLDVPGLGAQIPRRRTCYRGQSWSWDQVTFEVLHPPLSMYPGMNKDNNQSCVIRISANGNSILLTGDIESVVERFLLRSDTQTMALKADILLVPHHGSASSSTQAFIDQVAPQIALASTGYKNRYGFPKPHVVERYLQRGIELFTTSQYGAMTIILGGRSLGEASYDQKTGQDLSIKLDRAVRIDQKRFWYSR